MLPERLGKYSIQEVLGKGAMGVVYKAFDPHIRRTVALKVIRKEFIEDDEAATLIARFKNEAQAAGQLSHPGIVAIYEYGEEDAVAYIAMEYVQGKGLREYFQRGARFELSDTVSIMTRLLDALAYAHDAGVVHRDIKPANIILTSNGKLKVADFGIAHLDSSNLTQAGAMMGTPGYMAPELYTGTSVDRRADIFSAGVVLYQLLTGVKPFTGGVETVAYKICFEPHVEPSKLVPELESTKFDGVVAKALAKAPEDRYPTAQEFLESVQDAYAAPVSPAVSAKAILVEVGPASAVADAPQSYPSQTDPVPERASVPPAGWNADLLKQIEQQLTRYLGPVARVIVKRVATSTTELDALYSLLAEELSTPQDKTDFLAARDRLEGTPPEKPQIASDQRASSAGWLTQQEIDQATHQLATYLGPIARIVVKKAVTGAAGRKNFYSMLAEHLKSENDRKRFLQGVSAAVPLKTGKGR
ncbi:MAG TPA: serine/threonine-protein kinase [Burkholderiales bacterium]|nr:serine/threonine-protein kinase [Burkholderiales bacterium]